MSARVGWRCSAAGNRPPPGRSALGWCPLVSPSDAATVSGAETVNMTRHTPHSRDKEKQLLGEILPLPCTHQLARHYNELSPQP